MMQDFRLSEYGFLRVAVAVPECRVAECDFNSEKIIELINEAEAAGGDVVVFPELAISSYTVADLFFQPVLLERSLAALNRIMEATAEKKCTVAVGLPIENNGKLYNCAAIVSGGRCRGIVPKTYIPNSGEFYEARWFSSADDCETDSVLLNGEAIPFGNDLIFSLLNYPHVKFGVEICEDLWTVNPPSNNLALAGANVIFNLSASNEYLGKYQYRRNLVAVQSARLNAAYVYCSAGCGESSTDTVYSGHGVIAENGTILAETKRFSLNSQLEIADIDIDKILSERLKNKTFGKSLHHKSYRNIEISSGNSLVNDLRRKIIKSPFVPSKSEDRAENCSEIFNIQTAALGKRLRTIHCENLVLGISGGLDSTLALLVACSAFRNLKIDLSKILAVTMPGFGTTGRTKSNAEELAELLGVSLRIIPIDKAVKQHFADINHDPNDLSVVYENSQARERTQILMDISNQVGGIVLGTGDLSEIALGWSTYNADHISMYNVNCGIPKTLVKYLVQWCAEEYYGGRIAEILTDICNTPISPELLPPDKDGNIIQETEKSVGSYQLNDFFLYEFVRFGYRPKKMFLMACIAFKGEIAPKEIKHWLRMFYTRFFRNQFKRSCIPDGPKVGTVALSPRADWRMATDTEAQMWLRETDSIEI